MKAKKIMVIDDEEGVVTCLTTLLEEHGYTTCWAPNVVEGLEKIPREQPDLICLDLLTTDKSGASLYRQIHNNPRLRDIPVLMITGLTAWKNLTLEARPDLRHLAKGDVIPPPEGYMERPIDQDALLKAIQETLSARDCAFAD
jgi:CheY-like chemotaxis protein